MHDMVLRVQSLCRRAAKSSYHPVMLALQGCLGCNSCSISLWSCGCCRFHPPSATYPACALSLSGVLCGCDFLQMSHALHLLLIWMCPAVACVGCQEPYVACMVRLSSSCSVCTSNSLLDNSFWRAYGLCKGKLSSWLVYHRFHKLMSESCAGYADQEEWHSLPFKQSGLTFCQTFGMLQILWSYI